MKAAILATALAGGVLSIGSALAQQQITGAGQFCIKGPTGSIKCDYQSMEQCQQERPQNENDRCVSRSEVESTVGGFARPGLREQAPAPGEQKD